MTGDLNFKILMAFLKDEKARRGKAGTDLKKLRLSCDIQ